MESSFSKLDIGHYISKLEIRSSSIDLVSLSLEIVMFRHCSQSIEKFSLQSSFANQKADMDLQKGWKEKIWMNKYSVH